MEILNGTGIAGLAGSTSDKFEELGYTVESVGNAESTDSNQLIVSSEYEDMVEVLLEDVLEELNISEITQTSDELDYTARIIIGVAP